MLECGFGIVLGGRGSCCMIEEYFKITAEGLDAAPQTGLS
jgi:hypothetical protein